MSCIRARLQAAFRRALEFLHFRAPKGRPIPAQANGLGQKRPSITASPEGASPSIPHVAFVVLHLPETSDIRPGNSPPYVVPPALPYTRPPHPPPPGSRKSRQSRSANRTTLAFWLGF